MQGQGARRCTPAPPIKTTISIASLTHTTPQKHPCGIVAILHPDPAISTGMARAWMQKNLHPSPDLSIAMGRARMHEFYTLTQPLVWQWAARGCMNKGPS